MTGKNVQFDDMEGGIFITGDVNHTKTERKYYEAPEEVTWNEKAPKHKTIWQEYLDDDNDLSRYTVVFSSEFSPSEFIRLMHVLRKDFFIEDMLYRRPAALPKDPHLGDIWIEEEFKTVTNVWNGKEWIRLQ